MWCIKTMGKETTRLLFNKLTTARSSSIFGVGNSYFSQRKRKKFRQYRLRHLFIFFLWVSLEYLCKTFLLLLNYLLSKKI